MENKKKKLIAVVGPTASGKSALALELAKIFDGEIVSCDSMQIYKRLDIGTAKPSRRELEEVRHHMIDIVDPAKIDSYSCAEFTAAAGLAIEDIVARKKTPILCGGTGLYIDSILCATEFADTPSAPEYREEMFALANERGNSAVFEILQEVDPESAEAIHPNNLKRVIRALEIYHASGVTKSEWDKRSHKKPSEYDACIIGLAYSDREKLYERINERVELMLRNGLVDEVKMLLSDGTLRAGTTAAQAIGYKELVAALDGKTTLDAAIEDIKRESRRYAKRQMTWFSRNKDIHWIYPDDICEQDRFKIIVNNAKKYLTEHDFCDIMKVNSETNV